MKTFIRPRVCCKTKFSMAAMSINFDIMEWIAFVWRTCIPVTRDDHQDRVLLPGGLHHHPTRRVSSSPLLTELITELQLYIVRFNNVNKMSHLYKHRLNWPTQT